MRMYEYGLVRKLFRSLFKIKRWIYWYALSNCRQMTGRPHRSSCVLCLGKGKIEFGENVHLGYFPSPEYYSAYLHIEARATEAYVRIGGGTFINNNASIIADFHPNMEGESSSGISIGRNCLIGVNFNCVNSDFHSLDPNNRAKGITCQSVSIGDNVFIGNDVTIVKGVSIGNGCTIGAKSLVTKSFPDNCIIAGNPARLIRRVS